MQVIFQTMGFLENLRFFETKRISDHKLGKKSFKNNFFMEFLISSQLEYCIFQ